MTADTTRHEPGRPQSVGGKRIAVLGGGAWGVALAVVARAAGNAVQIWARDPAKVSLPDPDLALSGDLGTVLAEADAVLLAIPAQQTRSFLLDHGQALKTQTPLVLCAKGIEQGSGKLLSEVVAEIRPEQSVAVLSGPGFSTEIVAGKPTAVTVAAADCRLSQDLAAMLSSSRFRCYATTDIIGVQAGGALKNVLAIAAGAAHGADLGSSANAALLTRGFVEIKRLGEALGGWSDTLNGLSGFGDLVLTCGSAQSRNFAYGVALARGTVAGFGKLAEGAHTAHVAARIARDHGLETPIIDATADLIDGRITIQQAVAALMARPVRNET